MWHSRFFGALLAVLALPGFTGGQMVLAAYPTSLEVSMSPSQETRGLDGSFQLAVMGGGTAPLDMPPEKSPAIVQPEKPVIETPKAIPVVVQPEKPVVETPKTTPKVSKPRKKKVKKADVKKAPAKQPAKEEEGFLTKTFNQLIGNDDDKKGAASNSQIQKTAGKTPEKEEEGLLTKTLKTLVGGDKKEEEKKAKKNPLSPLNTAPAGSAPKKKVEEQPKTAKSETKKTLKDSFEKLIGVGAVSDQGDPKSAKADTDKLAEETKSAKQKESGGLLEGILGGSDKKGASSATQQAKVKETVKKAPAPAKKTRKLAAKKYVADDEKKEEGQSSGNYGGAQKGKNLLKESFKTLVDDKKKVEEE